MLNYSPSLALWINEHFPEVNAQSVRALGLRDAKDIEIFKQASQQNAIIMSKDEDFTQLLERFGPPPPIILITCGNTSNIRMREILNSQLQIVLTLIKKGERLVEISG